MTKVEVNSKFEKLPEGYTYKLYSCGGHSKGVYVINTNGKETALAGKADEPIIFAPEPDKVYALGDVRDKLVKESLTEEEYYLHLHGYSPRTKKYIEVCRDNIYLIKTECDESTTIGDDWEKIGSGAFNSSDIYLTQEEGVFIAAFQSQADIDVFLEYRFYFSKRPTAKKVWEAYQLYRLDCDFRFGKYQETFNCWGCGHSCHWLDVAGNLKQKINSLENKYCGC